MATSTRLMTRRRSGLGGIVCLLFVFSDPAIAVEGRGAAVNSAGLEASREVDKRGLSALRSTRMRTPSGFLYPYPLLPPSYREWGSFELRGFLDLGFLGNAGDVDEAQFRKYSDWGEGFLLRDFTLDLRQKEGLGYLSASGGAAGRDDQFYRAEIGQFGRFRVTGFFDALPHRYANDARFLLDGAGTETLTLPSGLDAGVSEIDDIDTALAGLKRFGIEHTREDAGADISIRVLPELRLFSSYRNQRHEGLRAFGGTLGFTMDRTDSGSVIELLEPLDSITHDWSAGVEYAREPFQLNLTYHGSWFENDFEMLTWESPFEYRGSDTEPSGRSSLSPDNHSHQFVGAISARLPWNTRFTASGSFTRFLQNDQLLAPTINAVYPDWTDASTALSRQRADARVDQISARASLQMKPLRSLSLRVTGRYFERDNDTKYIAYNPAADFTGYIVEDQDTGSINPKGRVGAPGFSYKRWSVESKASLRIDSKTRAGFEFQHEETTRENRSRRVVRDERVRLNLTTRAMPHTNLRLAYQFLHRGGSSFDYSRDQALYADPTDPTAPAGPAAGLTSFRQFDLVSRNQHKLDLRTNWQIGETVDLSLAGRFQEGNPDTDYGVIRERSAGLDADVNYLHSPDFDLRAFGSLEWRSHRVKSIVGTGSPAVYPPLDNEWSLDSEIWNFSLGTGARYRPAPKFELRLDYTYLWSREKLEYTFASEEALPRRVEIESLPDHFRPRRFKDHVLDAQASYQWTEYLKTTLFYRLQHTAFEDFQQGSLQPRINHNLYLAHTDNDFTTHVFGASIGLRF